MYTSRLDRVGEDVAETNGPLAATESDRHGGRAFRHVELFHRHVTPDRVRELTAEIGAKIHRYVGCQTDGTLLAR